MTKYDYPRIFETAEELAKRFPDLSDYDVLDHVRFVHELPYIESNTVLGHAIMSAYHAENADYGMAWYR